MAHSTLMGELESLDERDEQEGTSIVRARTCSHFTASIYQGLYLKFLPLCINASPIMLHLIFVILPFLTNATNPVFAQAMMIDS